METLLALGLTISIGINLLWIGFFKFFEAEAEDIKPMVANSPFTRWMYKLGDVQQTSIMIGMMEIVSLCMVIVGFFIPIVGVIGSSIWVIMFLVTLSFLFTTPQITERHEGYSFPTDNGAYLLKDLVLLVGSVYLLWFFIEEYPRGLN